jgi:hypothetical protein
MAAVGLVEASAIPAPAIPATGEKTDDSDWIDNHTFHHPCGDGVGSADEERCSPRFSLQRQNQGKTGCAEE